jgi:myo-inositol-1(or 4)-monophosphatase
VIDPLDGTVNCLYGFPSHSVSIAVELDGVPIIGVVYDTAHDEMYVARIDGTTTKNGHNVQVTSCKDSSIALLGTRFAYQSTLRQQQALSLSQLLPQVRDIRRVGSCAIDLCSVASGRLDAFYETGVQWWDVAAGVAIVRSAGGIAVYEPLHKRVVASGPLLWKQLCSTINEAEIATGSQCPPPSANI